ncbi:hypothetical protein D9611_007279 [Ephemerocybe angulata]|uniref:C3H1-type domain-containing protein n=1 Tax=Ephemerocybe angulata TaxID=980116 RepID=A0A8H5EWB7_9AGAR|nr:hypothetical protein D9611_007279 [Tulosesus angulatus]
MDAVERASRKAWMRERRGSVGTPSSESRAKHDVPCSDYRSDSLAVSNIGPIYQVQTLFLYIDKHIDETPTADSHGEQRSDYDRSDRGDKKAQKAAAANSKSAKDLSHVPCKFFKVGGCTAGPSCPFSHTLPEPGQKEHCAWFVNGNCKKNKKAAQQGAAAAGGHDRDGKERGGKGSKRDAGGADRGHGGRNALLGGGSTAPTCVLNSGGSASGRPPMGMALKASISPSAPAPPLNDTDFASFASLDEMDEMEGVSGDSREQQKSEKDDKEGNAASEESGTLPLSAPRNPSSAVQNDFGPIGSPPNARSPMAEQRSPTRLNATFYPGTSPRTTNLTSTSPAQNNGASSPFSAPGNQTSFYQPSSYGASLGLAGGVAASLGSGLAMMGGGRRAWGDPSSYDASGNGAYSRSGLSSSVTRVDEEYEYLSGVRNQRRMQRMDSAVVDEEMEDFIPGSLTDLLTPEERSRRMSRSNSGQPPVTGLTGLVNTLKGGDEQSSGSMMGHRHSRSVPAPSLLGDLKSIWADTSANPLPSSPRDAPHMTHRGTPSASGLSARFESLGLGNGGAIDEGGMSMSFGSPSSIGMLSPSNASAAFLPGFHQNYLGSKAKRDAQLAGQSGMGRGLRSVSGGNGLYDGRVNNSSIANNYLQPMSSAGLPASVNNASTFHTHIHGNTQTTYKAAPSPFDLTQSMNMIRSSNLSGHATAGIGRGMGGPADGVDDAISGPNVLSPSTRALQSHAPGQSLPQGLAAGLSRIHALPPSTLASPGTPGAASYLSGSPAAFSSNAHQVYGDWQAVSGSPLVQSTVAPGHGRGHGAPPGLPEPSGTPSKMSYSAAAAAARAANATPLAPPGITRNPGGYGGQQQQRSANDDDELFDMDG